MHCFSGSRELAAQFLHLGLYISFAGPITFSNAVKLREVASDVPIDRILIETDSPYLTPQPYRGKRNEPSYVKKVGEKLAEVKGISVNEAKQITAGNARSLFGIGG